RRRWTNSRERRRRTRQRRHGDRRQHRDDPGVRQRRQRHDLARRIQWRAARRPAVRRRGHDGTDLFEGGDGVDTAEVNGGNGAETFSIIANGTRVRFDRLGPAPFSLDIGTTENLVLNMNGGDDTFTAGNGLAALITL